jgi:hypothetical protein
MPTVQEQLSLRPEADYMLNVFIVALAFPSTVVFFVCLVVAWQWPQPQFLCWRTPFSDLCSALHPASAGAADAAADAAAPAAPAAPDAPADSPASAAATAPAPSSPRRRVRLTAVLRLHVINLLLVFAWAGLLAVKVVTGERRVALPICLLEMLWHISVAVLFRARFRFFPPHYGPGPPPPLPHAPADNGVGGVGEIAGAALSANALADLARLGQRVDPATGRPLPQPQGGGAAAASGGPVLDRAGSMPMTTAVVRVGGAGAGDACDVEAVGVPAPPRGTGASAAVGVPALLSFFSFSRRPSGPPPPPPPQQ